VQYSMTSPADLNKSEVWWKDHQKWFQDCGFMLRPRYMPDWKPSWLDDSDKFMYLCEDAQTLPVRLDGSPHFYTHV
jgi:hypothetical protein